MPSIALLMFKGVHFVPITRTVTLSAGLLLAAVLPGWSQTLRYDGESGSTRTYSRTQTDHVRQTVNGEEQSVDIESYWRFDVRLAETGPEALTLEIVHDSISITGSPSPVEDFSAIYGEPVVVVLGDRGEVREITLPESLPASAARLDFETTYRTFFPTLPAGEVEPGTTWSDTLDQTSDQNGLDLSVRRINHYTVAGQTQHAGRDAVQVDYTTAIELEGTGSQQGAEISLSGTGSGNGSFFFDPEAGLYLGGGESTEVKMDAFIAAGGQNQLIPIVTTRQENVTLLDS